MQPQKKLLRTDPNQDRGEEGGGEGGSRTGKEKLSIRKSRAAGYLRNNIIWIHNEGLDFSPSFFVSSASSDWTLLACLRAQCGTRVKKVLITRYRHLLENGIFDYTTTS